jgi:hypothetical protein
MKALETKQRAPLGTCNRGVGDGDGTDGSNMVSGYRSKRLTGYLSCVAVGFGWCVTCCVTQQYHKQQRHNTGQLFHEATP